MRGEPPRRIEWIWQGQGKQVEKKQGGVEPSPFASIRVQNKRGGVEPFSFVSIRVQNKRGGVEPSSFASIHVQNKRGGVEPSSFVNVSKTNGEGVEPSPFTSIRVQNKRGGIEPSSFVNMCPRQTGRGWTLPVRVNTCPKQTRRDCTLPVHINMCPKQFKQTGRVCPSPFASICIQKKWRGLNPPHSCQNWSKPNGEGATWLRNPPAFRYALAVPTLSERIPRPAGCRDPFGRTYAFIMLRNTIPPRSVTSSFSVLLRTTPHVISVPICFCDILPYDFHSLSLWTCSRWNT